MARGSSVRASAGTASIEEPAERAVAGAAQHAFERVIPQRDAAVAVDHRHALLEEVDHLAPAVLLFEPVDVVGIQRDRRRTARRQRPAPAPQPAIDHFDDAPPRRRRRAGSRG